MALETTTDPTTWAAWCRAVELDDVYYRFDYLSLWEKEERGRIVGIRYTRRRGAVLYPVVRVSLEPLGLPDDWFDVRTAYDFGGPRAFGDDTDALLTDFGEQWGALMAESGAVTEFARLLPLGLPALPKDRTFHADNFVVDLRRTPADLWEAYDSSFRGKVRQARDRGLEAHSSADPDRPSRSTFVALYRETMRAVDADPFYFFDERTLHGLMALPEATLFTVEDRGDVVAASIVLRSGEDLFSFLSASDRSALALRPNNLLHHAIIVEGARSEARCLHLGGGPDGVRQFKSHMATGTVPYSLIERVHDEAKFERACRAAGVPPDGETFPPYRHALLAADRPGSNDGEETDR